MAFLWATCFHNKSNLGTKSLFHPSMIMYTLHLTYVTFPSTPTIDSTRGNFVAHESRKQQFISYIFFFFIVCQLCLYLGLINNYNNRFNILARICKNKRIHKNAIREKKLCFKFLGTTKGGAMANVTTKLKVKIFHLKSKTLNFQVLVIQQWTLNTGVW